MPEHLRPAIVSSLTAVALLVLSGCQSGGSSSPASSATHTSGSSTAASSAATGTVAGSTAPVASTPVDVCALMPLATAKALTGEPFIRAYPYTEKAPVQHYSCNYQEAGSNLAVASLIVVPGKGGTWYDGPAGDPSSKPYPGLGDKAVYNPDPVTETKVTLDALFGSTDFEFDDFTDSDITNAKAAAVIRAAAAKLKLRS